MKIHGRMICVYLCRVKCEQISLQPTMKYWDTLNSAFPKFRAPQLDHNPTTYTVSTWAAPYHPCGTWEGKNRVNMKLTLFVVP